MQYIEANLLVKEISKELFYKESGITTASMSQWRSGKHNPSEKAVKKAEDFFNKFENKRGYLAMQDLPCLDIRSIANEKSSTTEVVEPFEGYSDLTMEEREKVKDYIALLLAARQTQ